MGSDRALDGTTPRALLDLAKMAHCEHDPLIQDLVLALAVTDDPQLARDLIEPLQMLATEALIEGIPFSHPDPNKFVRHLEPYGGILVGALERAGQRVFVPQIDWAQNAMVVGAPGTGKTNLLYSLAIQAMRQGIAVWIIDNHKQEFRHLNRFQELPVLDAQRDLVFNPLEVPSPIDPRHLLAAFVSVFAKSQNIYDASEGMASEIVHRLFEERGVFAGSDNFPTLFDVLDGVRSYPVGRFGRTKLYQDTLTNRLRMMLTSAPQIYACSKGFPIGELAQMSFVLEVKGLSERHARFLVLFLIFVLFLWRIARNERGSGIRNLIIVDECKWVAPPDRSEGLGFPPLAYVMSQCREAEIGLVMADQTADLDAAIAVNSRTKIAFRMGDGNDIDRVRKSFKLSEDQAAYIPKLDVGRAVCRIPGVDPFLIQVPRVRLQ